MISDAASLSEDKMREEVKELVSRYRKLKGKRKEKGLKEISEADVRADFIDPLFGMLGWDVRNPDEYNREKYVRGAGLADIALMIEEKPAAFVEAKRFQSIPSVNRTEIDWIEQERQVMNYAMGEGIKWAILMNFEKLRVFNAFNGKMIFSIEDVYEYADNIKYLMLLSKESFEKGTIDRFEAHEEKPDIDLGFLEKLNRWRMMLANAIYGLNKDNPELMESGEFSLERLKSAVQRLLDRMIIVRYAEDRLILDRPDQLMILRQAWEGTKAYTSLYDNINGYFKGFDRIHDSSIFEGGHICEKVKMDDEVLAEIIDDLYSVNFRKFDFDILGNTYETYLGNTLAFGDKDGIALKPAQESRKKSGIYYTPPYVVDYIVKNTLGELLKGKSVGDVEKIRVLDPSCGSGSFLIKAYAYFAGFYEDENRKIEKKKNELLKDIKKNGNGVDDYSALSELKKYEGYEKLILKNNIYGVDLDEHAAEIASVNLMLKALKQKEKLPLILGDHIKVGNSLISGDDETLKKYFGDDWKEKRPFNWEDEFPEVFRGDNPGFDVIIGNPPYISTFMIDLSERKFFREKFFTSGKEMNTFSLFIEKSLKLLNKLGMLAFIIPDSFLTVKSYVKLRTLILKTCKITAIVNISGGAFQDAEVGNSVIIILQKEDDEKNRKKNRIRTYKFINSESNGMLLKELDIVEQAFYEKSIENMFYLNESSILFLNKVYEKGIPLSEIAKIKDGIKTGNNKRFIRHTKESEAYKKLLIGRDIYRYFLKFNQRYVLYDAELLDGARNEQIFLAKEKIILRQTGDKIIATYDDQQYYTLDSTHIILPSSDLYHTKYLLGILNSKLINYYYRLLVPESGRVYAQVRIVNLEKLPICKATDKQQKELAELADKMLSLNERLSEIDIDFERYAERRPVVGKAKLSEYIEKPQVMKRGGKVLNEMECDGTLCKFKGLNVEESGEELIFRVSVEEVRKSGAQISRFEFMRVKVGDEKLRKFLYFWIKNYVKPSKIGKGNVLRKILNLKLPRFENSDRKNTEVIHEIMDEYLPNLESWNMIKKEIDDTDAEIDRKVYGLYELTQEEIKIVEESFGDD